MSNETTTPSRLYFPGIASSAFEHPLDRAALEALRRTPGFDKMLKTLSEWGMERYLRAAYTGDAIRVSPRQCSRLYKDLREACGVLDVAEPEFYLMQNPHPAVYFFGMQRHTIVLTTSLVDLMTDEERLALIGRELGHIKAEHMLYRTMAMHQRIYGEKSAIALAAAIAWCFQAQLPKIRGQHALIEQVMEEVRAARRLRGLDTE